MDFRATSQPWRNLTPPTSLAGRPIDERGNLVGHCSLASRLKGFGVERCGSRANDGGECANRFRGKRAPGGDST